MLSIYDVIVTQKMYNGHITLGGTIILLALFAQKLLLGENYMFFNGKYISLVPDQTRLVQT